jgi:hypothetical protein
VVRGSKGGEATSAKPIRRERLANGGGEGLTPPLEREREKRGGMDFLGSASEKKGATFKNLIIR